MYYVQVDVTIILLRWLRCSKRYKIKQVVKQINVEAKLDIIVSLPKSLT